MVTASMRSSPWITFSSQKVRRSILTAAHSSCTLRTVGENSLKQSHAATVRQVQELCAAGKMDLRTFWELKVIHGDERIEAVTIYNSKTKVEERLAVDNVIPQLGFISSLGAIEQWGLDIEQGEIKVSQTMATNLPGVFAAGDITTYPGKLKLIATGAAEAAIAVNHAVHFINPAAKVAPGHSSNMALFGQTED